jgi:hypothetical protein
MATGFLGEAAERRTLIDDAVPTGAALGGVRDAWTLTRWAINRGRMPRPHGDQRSTEGDPEGFSSSECLC